MVIELYDLLDSSQQVMLLFCLLPTLYGSVANLSGLFRMVGGQHWDLPQLCSCTMAEDDLQLACYSCSCKLRKHCLASQMKDEGLKH